MLIADEQILADTRPVSKPGGLGTIDDCPSVRIIMIEETLAGHSPRIVASEPGQAVVPFEASEPCPRSFTVYELEHLAFAAGLRVDGRSRYQNCDQGKRRKKLSFHHVLQI